jgi:hypothetical protein
MGHGEERRANRRFAPKRMAWVVLVVVGALVAAAIGVGLGGSGTNPAAAGGTGSSPSGSQSRVVKTFVFGGEIASDEDTTSLPMTNWPPSEAIERYKVPANSRLVIESAYVAIYESFEDPSQRRDGFDAHVRTYYPTPADCAFLGYERNYGLAVGSPVVQFDSATAYGSLQGPIYVEGGRYVTGEVVAPGGDSGVIGLITVHGYLEPAVNPKPPVLCT